jgi:hypothetical protein
MGAQAFETRRLTQAALSQPGGHIKESVAMCPHDHGSCRSHHRAVHRASDEKAWWKQAAIDPIKVARKLCKHTRVDKGRIEPEPTAQGATADRPAENASDRPICSTT